MKEITRLTITYIYSVNICALFSIITKTVHTSYGYLVSIWQRGKLNFGYLQQASQNYYQVSKVQLTFSYFSVSVGSVKTYLHGTSQY